MRLIDADVLLDSIFKSCNTTEATINNAPTIDAVPVVRGEWMDDMYSDEPVTRCTACKRGFAKGHKAERFPYCPNCGAKMKMEREK